MNASHDRQPATLKRAIAQHRSAVAGRVLTWPNCRNTRDLGDIPVEGGGRTRRGVLVRSDSLARLDARGVSAALEHGVGTVIDLRESRILARYPYPSALLDSVRYHHVPLLPDDFPLPVPTAEYGTALRLAAPRLAEIASLIAAEPGVSVFHCHSGTGRTGLVAMTLLALAEVDLAANLADHLFDLPAATGDTGAQESPAVAERLAAAARLLDDLRRVGGPAEFLRSAGATAEDLEVLRRRFVRTPRLNNETIGGPATA